MGCPVLYQVFLVVRGGISFSVSVWLCLFIQLEILGRLTYIYRERTNKNVDLLLRDSSSFTFPGMLIACQWKM